MCFRPLFLVLRLRAIGLNVSKMDHVLPIVPTLDSLNEHLLEEIYTWIPGEQSRFELRHCLLAKGEDATPQDDIQTTLLEWDARKGILLAATSVLDGFVTGWNTSWSALNNESVETVVEILRDAAEKKRQSTQLPSKWRLSCVFFYNLVFFPPSGADFSLLIVSDVIAPIVQQLLRRKNSRHDGPFQQLIGFLTDLVGDIYANHHEGTVLSRSVEPL